MHDPSRLQCDRCYQALLYAARLNPHGGIKNITGNGFLNGYTAVGNDDQATSIKALFYKDTEDTGLIEA
jgi:hypothetical protein